MREIKQKSRTKINIGYTLLYRVTTMLIPLLTSPYLSRVLGAEKIGEYSYASAIAYYFFSFSMLGVNDYGNREVAKVRDDKEKLSDTFWQIFYLQFFLSLFLTGVYLLIVLFTFNNEKLVAIFFSFYVLSAMTDINWFSYGIEKFKYVSTIWVTFRLLSAVLIFIFVKTPLDLWKYTLIINGGTFVFALFNWPIVFKNVYFKKPCIKKIKQHLLPNFILFLPAIALSVYHYMDRLMMGWWSEKAQVGFYNYAENIISIPMGITIAVENVMLPKASHLVEKEDKNEEFGLLYKTIDLVCALNIAFAFGIGCVAKLFVPWYLGQEYIISAELVIILAPVIFISGFSGIIRYQYLIPRRLDKAYLISIVSGAIINFILNLVFIPRFASKGASIATVAAYFVVAIVQFFYTKKEINYLTIARYILPYFLFGCIMAGIVTIIPPFSSVFVTLLIKILTGVIIYGVFFFIFKKNKRPKYNG